MVVENRAGAVCLIARDAVAEAFPHGYTLMLADSSILIAQHLQPRKTFDPLKNFAPVSAVFTLPLVIVTSNDFLAKTLRNLLRCSSPVPENVRSPRQGLARRGTLILKYSRGLGLFCGPHSLSGRGADLTRSHKRPDTDWGSQRRDGHCVGQARQVVRAIGDEPGETVGRRRHRSAV